MKRLVGYLVRIGKYKGQGVYRTDAFEGGQWSPFRKQAHVFDDFAVAKLVANETGGRVVRLVTRRRFVTLTIESYLALIIAEYEVTQALALAMQTGLAECEFLRQSTAVAVSALGVARESVELASEALGDTHR